MKKARLLVTYQCPRSCEGCCNKEWKGPQPEPIDPEDLKDYDEIIVTGGEPTLFQEQLDMLVTDLVAARLIIYSASPDGVAKLDLEVWDGITLTLHDDKAVDEFDARVAEGSLDFSDAIKYDKCNISLRLHVFEGVRQPAFTGGWKIKKDLVWIKDCPLPVGEEFFRLHKLFEEEDHGR